MPRSPSSCDLPRVAGREFGNRGYYGTVSHNVKAVYQRYFGWFDGNPANLHPLPPEPAAAKYVEYMGGAAAVLARAREDFEAGEYRWVAQVVNHVVFADPGNTEARELQAAALEQLGFQAESGPWRNFYLSGALELRDGVRPGRPIGFLRGDMLAALATAVVFDWLGVRLNADKAAGLAWKIDWRFTDRGEVVAQTLENATLTQRIGKPAASAHASVTTTRTAFDRVVAGGAAFEAIVANGEAQVAGDASLPGRLFTLLDVFQPMFPVVTPV